jgi:hypothetical protein
VSSDITLQINLSPGDVAYAERTVPALLAAHPSVAERLLVVDVCKPQRTGIVDPAKRFPEPAYGHRVEKILGFAESLRASGRVDRVEIMRPDSSLFPQLARRYLRPWMKETHDYGGCALMSYLAAFELCRTRHLLHYDADMLLYQAPGYDWAPPAADAMARLEEAVAGSPRQAPPPEGTDGPTSHERISVETCESGWLNAWFSTRCYLFDMEKLRPRLPLLQGRVYWESLAARLRGRGYPRSPEIMLFRRMSATGGKRLTLSDRRAWMLHPVRKDARFIASLERLLACVARGECPPGQRGVADLNLELPDWENLLSLDL